MDPLYPHTETLYDYLHDLSKTWPVLNHLRQIDPLISNIQDFSKPLKTFRHVVVLGTGGSSLGGQALVSALNPDVLNDRLIFLDNIDPLHFKKTFDQVPLEHTAILAISKSGKTLETLMQLLTCFEIFGSSVLKKSEQFFVITELTKNPMMQIAQEHHLSVFPHPTDVGGRFSVFTAVGLLPAYLANIDIASLCKGALDAFYQGISEGPAASAPVLSALHHSILYDQQILQLVLFIYSSYLLKYGQWFAQLWAESLGKRDQLGQPFGITPVLALGTVDQHSQLQLYMDGPNNKHFRFITIKSHPNFHRISTSAARGSDEILSGHTMADLFIAEQKATIEALRSLNKPVSVLEIKSLTPYYLGSSMMYAMLETLLLARLRGLNAFDQPAVEDVKKRTREVLSPK